MLGRLLRQLEVLFEVFWLDEDGGAVGEVGGGQRMLRRAAAGLLATPTILTQPEPNPMTLIAERSRLSQA